jgi:anti-sigma regulatory factor (Ser/Thr protein kinase)
LQLTKLQIPKEFFPEQNDKSKVIIIKAPAIICIYGVNTDNYDHTNLTIKFLNTISDVTLKQNGRLHIDFSKTTRITAAASVLIFAEITRVQLFTNISDAITFNLPKDKECARLFRTSGLFKAIMPGTSRKMAKLFDEDHTYQTGTDPNKFLISTQMNLFKSGLELSKPEAKLISVGIQEAMLNVIHHAYCNYADQHSGIGSRWWQLINCDTKQKNVTFIICDKGISIPLTISEQTQNHMSHADAIEFAFREGVTRFIGTTRGKGSQDIIDAAKIKDNSTLLVMSGKGVYFIDGVTNKKLKSELPYPINGTLIEWSIPYE